MKARRLIALALGIWLSWGTAGWGQDAMPDDQALSTLKKPAPPQAAPIPPPPPNAPSAGTDEEIATNWVVLGGLDKLTARVVTIEAEVGRTTRFGQLEIIARTCRTRGPEAASPESAAFLDIWDMKPNQPAQSVFRGWMFASSPALSAMEHPIYDVWVLGCKSR